MTCRIQIIFFAPFVMRSWVKNLFLASVLVLKRVPFFSMHDMNLICGSSVLDDFPLIRFIGMVRDYCILFRELCGMTSLLLYRLVCRSENWNKQKNDIRENKYWWHMGRDGCT